MGGHGEGGIRPKVKPSHLRMAREYVSETRGYSLFTTRHPKFAIHGFAQDNSKIVLDIKIEATHNT
jgi:hypothetical protein